ncbi:hypothetical protein N7532_001068 [Penicillium argentinense]|uniref:Uncharacterized protein n=1 Tax=Penicillium argentinense TaxID=1131581 RepID=A0A9W9KM32_9EURO|nr:uncharacterized protein N7532_001068 [Penicillium argentinense]KAJ5110533.1 hypothetical protein N7532_001068 [Penicillium argentinense]
MPGRRIPEYWLDKAHSSEPENCPRATWRWWPTVPQGQRSSANIPRG